VTEHQATREAVLDAALAGFTEHTYGGTAMSVLATRAGVAVGTIYRHFPSKEALGNAVYQRWKARLGADLVGDAAGADGIPVREEFGRMWRGLLRFAAEHPDAFAFLELQQHASYLDADSVALTDRIERAGTELIIRGQESGEIRAGDPAVLVALVYGAFVGLAAALRSTGGIGADQYELAENAVWDLLGR
jgi:TetR/AcrR family transcriptional regulator, repressor of fatR-cypB operon